MRNVFFFLSSDRACGHALCQCQSSCTRYKNILPFDYCRVVLKEVDNSVEGADYINASAITGEIKGPGNNYIACQGCLKATVAAFWQMVWEQNNRIIVMTTAVVERGKNKCAPYWPVKNRSSTYLPFF